MTKKEFSKNLEKLNNKIQSYKEIVNNAEKVIKLIYRCDHSGIDIFNDEIKKIDTHYSIEDNKLIFENNDIDGSFKFKCSIVPTDEITTLDAKKTSSSFIHNCCELQYKIGQLESTKSNYDIILNKVDLLKKNKDTESLDRYLENLPIEFIETFQIK